MEFPDPWYLTVVATQGIQFLRPERSWRPIVGVTVVDHDRTHETTLGCDGRNPNLKAPIELHEVHHASRIEIKVWHQSHTKKSKRKRYLVGSVFLTLGDLVRKQDKPTSNIPLNLKCPPMRKRSPTVSGGRQLNCAMIVVRLAPPTSPIPSSSRTPTLVASNYTSDCEDHVFSDDQTLDGRSDSLPASPTESADETTRLLPGSPSDDGESTLRRRKRKRAGNARERKPKAYHIHTTDEESSDSSSDSDCPPTPPSHKPQDITTTNSQNDDDFDIDVDEIYNITFITSPPSPSNSQLEIDYFGPDVCMPRTAICPPPQPLSRLELALDSFSPYRELSHPRCDFGKVLERALREWWTVGGYLLGMATLNAAVFGYSSGQDSTLFAMDGLALRSVTLGSITAAIGLIVDAWFLVLYSSCDIDRFRRLAADISSIPSSSRAPETNEDAYPTYFYFCLTCRLPTVCLFLSSCSLMMFLLAVAWSAWPTAVLVMCFLAGVVLTLQYLVFGAKRLIGGVVWAARKVLGVLASGGVGGASGKGRRLKKNGGRLSVPPVNLGPGADGESERRIERGDSLPPPPYSSPRPMAQELHGEAREAEWDGEGVELGPSISRREGA